MTQPSSSEALSGEAQVGKVADEFTERCHRGEQPDVEEYARRYPHLAELLREVLPALQALAGTGSSPPAPRQEFSDLPGGCLGDYRIVREVGRGGMGIVYEAEQLSLGRRVALKVLPFAAALDPRHLQRFKNEAQAAAHLHHTHIVPVFGVGCERGVHYYAMQLIEGQTLAALIGELRGRSGPTGEDPFRPPSWTGTTIVAPRDSKSKVAPPAAPPTAAGKETVQSTSSLLIEGAPRSPAYFRAVAQLGIQAAEALEHAHQGGLFHRDIKPANLLVDARGQLWVTDFGLARLRNHDAGLTLTGDLLGTVRYMSPEQAQGKHAFLDQRADVYSLGATLYELLTLEPAFPGQSREEVLGKIIREEPVRPRRLNPALPLELETIVLKALARNPEERYQSAQELAEDLRRFLEDRPIQARRPTLVQRFRKWTRRHRGVVRALALAGVVGVLGLAGATVLIW